MQYQLGVPLIRRSLFDQAVKRLFVSLDRARRLRLVVALVQKHRVVLPVRSARVVQARVLRVHMHFVRSLVTQIIDRSHVGFRVVLRDSRDRLVVSMLGNPRLTSPLDLNVRRHR